VQCAYAYPTPQRRNTEEELGLTTYSNDPAHTLREVFAIAFDRLASEPHDTIPGLKRRYYYRGSFILLERLSPRGLAVNVKRLRRRGEPEHANLLATAWKDANGETVTP
jgi:hypothetical protein